MFFYSNRNKSVYRLSSLILCFSRKLCDVFPPSLSLFIFLLLLRDAKRRRDSVWDRRIRSIENWSAVFLYSFFLSFLEQSAIRLNMLSFSKMYFFFSSFKWPFFFDVVCLGLFFFPVCKQCGTDRMVRGEESDSSRKKMGQKSGVKFSSSSSSSSPI